MVNETSLLFPVNALYSQTGVTWRRHMTRITVSLQHRHFCLFLLFFVTFLCSLPPPDLNWHINQHKQQKLCVYLYLYIYIHMYIYKYKIVLSEQMETLFVRWTWSYVGSWLGLAWRAGSSKAHWLSWISFVSSEWNTQSVETTTKTPGSPEPGQLTVGHPKNLVFHAGAGPYDLRSRSSSHFLDKLVKP